MTHPTHPSNERGVAMITALMMMMLISALLVGFTAVVMSDQRHRFIDKDRSQAFYAASAGLEKMTADLGTLFFANVAPSAAQVQALTTNPPTIPGVVFTKSNSASGYEITAAAPTTTTISAGPYQGLIALMTEYTMDVTARTVAEGEVHLQRKTEAVAIPVFQFGIYSDVDLSFFAGPNFDFGGRVHTNGNLFLSEGPGNTLTLRDKVTAVGEVIRQRLANGASIATPSAHDGTVRVATATNVFRNLAPTEGSLVDGIGSAQNEPTWHNMSLSAYNGYIRNGRTGAKRLDLPLITAGGTNADLVGRPVANEDTDFPVKFSQRYFPQVSLRILLSDTAADILSVPTVTVTQPVSLGDFVADNNWRNAPPNNGTAYGPVDLAHPPIARSPGLTTATVTTGGAAVAAGANRTLPIPLNVPAAWKVQNTNGAITITVNKISPPAASYNYVCSGKSPNTFTGCVGLAGHAAVAWGGAQPATVTATIVGPDGNVNVSTTLAANTIAGAAAQTITVAIDGTMTFARNTFFVNGNLITCGGYDGTNLRNCNLPVDVPNGSVVTTSALSATGTAIIGGFIKIERQGTDGVWADVTMEILNYGIGARNIVNGAGGANAGGAQCADPTPNAILRIQRLRDNNWATCTYAGGAAPMPTSNDYWPQTLFDAREGLLRDTSPGNSNIALGGVMHYIALDVANLSNWFRAVGAYAGGTGANSRSTNNGYSVYFSDRRNNRNASNVETGRYGWEDITNPNDAANGAPNGALDAGEDVDASNTLDDYGKYPSYLGVANSVPPAPAPNASPLDINARPTTYVLPSVAKVNRALHFRHALKLINGGLGNIITPGLTVATENPVYIQGDWNANQAGFGDPHAATSVAADAVTLLSNAWNDVNSFANPYSPGNRVRDAQTYYRVAIIGGKNPAFPMPAGAASDFGTDGGTHNFLRYLESGGTTLNYRGSIATFFYSRQATGTYKCCTTVYGPPGRAYAFDIEFLSPALLPPLTPVFRDLNTIGFSQETRPGK